VATAFRRSNPDPGLVRFGGRPGKAREMSGEGREGNDRKNDGRKETTIIY